MKTSELRRLVEKDGWYIKRHGAKHDIYVHPTKPNVLQIGRHSSEEVKKGTCEDTLKKAGLR